MYITVFNANRQMMERKAARVTPHLRAAADEIALHNPTAYVLLEPDAAPLCEHITPACPDRPGVTIRYATPVRPLV